MPRIIKALTFFFFCIGKIFYLTMQPVIIVFFTKNSIFFGYCDRICHSGLLKFGST